MLAAAAIRSAQDATVQPLLASAADARVPRWQRDAVLRGAEIALLDGAPPGGMTGRTNAPALAGGPPLPCPTCPGGRAGPGGAYAFPRPQSGGGRGAGPRLRLNREPVPFTALAAGSDDLAARAAGILARVSWPGKAGDAAAVAPLAPEAQRRYDRGQEVYRNICQSCHQPDGRGQEKVAPSLIGSALTLAAVEVPARILLHGKEGRIGLMPPIGATLSDEDVASVLTYVRREWGNAAEPVDPAAVAGVRSATASRTRPWTDAELAAIAAGGRGGK
jgi:mono/diheme cytochrome c family protein